MCKEINKPNGKTGWQYGGSTQRPEAEKDTGAAGKENHSALAALCVDCSCLDLLRAVSLLAYLRAADSLPEFCADTGHHGEQMGRPHASKALL